MKRYKISARWMDEHLDCWPEEEVPRPTGSFKGNLWIGELTDKQAAEVEDRADFGAECWDGCPTSMAMAKRVLASIKKQRATQ